jgi:hypothetical protein
MMLAVETLQDTQVSASLMAPGGMDLQKRALSMWNLGWSLLGNKLCDRLRFQQEAGIVGYGGSRTDRWHQVYCLMLPLTVVTRILFSRGSYSTNPA